MLKYVEVDSDGYAYLGWARSQRLHELGYQVGRANDDWVLYRKNGYRHELLYETTDHIQFDNYLKLLLED
jgi:hypothetical protein